MINKIWLAGFIDGDGCFNVTKNNWNYYPRLLITNTNKEILEKIRDHYGGDLRGRSTGPANWKTVYFYRAAWKVFRAIAMDVIPYLEIKKEQASLCIDMLDTKDKEKRIAIKEKINELNKRGK